MSGNPEDDRPPVFIVGCGRSGTTVLYEAIARHPQAAWFSTWTDRTLRPELAAFNSRFKMRAHPPRLGPRPSEGYRLWDAALRLAPRMADEVLDGRAAGPDSAGRLTAVIERHRRFGRGTLFVNKNTRNSRRIGLLDSLLEGRFIHVLRSPLDTVASILEVAWWRGLSLWWRGGATPASLSQDPVAQASLAAELWCRETSAALDAAIGLPPGRYREVRYEELVRDPAGALERTLAWLGLGTGPGGARALVPATSQRSVGSFADRLSASQADAVATIAQPVADRAGYGDPLAAGGAGDMGGRSEARAPGSPP